jgi:hypothetical protein
MYVLNLLLFSYSHILLVTTYNYERGQHAVRHLKYPARPYTIPTSEPNATAYPIPDRIEPVVEFSLEKNAWEKYKREAFLEAPFTRRSRGGRKRRLKEQAEEDQRSASPSSRASFTPSHSGANTPAIDSPLFQSHNRSQSRSSRPPLTLGVEGESSSRAQSPVWHSLKESLAWKERGKVPHCRFSTSLISTSNRCSAQWL